MPRGPLGKSLKSGNIKINSETESLFIHSFFYKKNGSLDFHHNRDAGITYRTSSRWYNLLRPFLTYTPSIPACGREDGFLVRE
jgi:hypothetical protein